MKIFRLKKEEREQAIGWYSRIQDKKLQQQKAKEDCDWIETCVNGDKDIAKMKFFDEKTKRENSWQTALKKLGRETFFNGLSRACFHWNCGRKNIYFDCSPCFRS